MHETSADILERFRTRLGKDIDLTLRAPYRALLERLGHPENKLRNVVHVAGTNGKGSTCAFLRAMLEAAGYRVNVYTSPHLVSLYERIRLAGRLIREDELYPILARCEALAEEGQVSYFEAWTAAAFTAFAEAPADVTLLEVGLGGRLDATNVVAHPAVDIITRLSFDHRDYLGTTMASIAREKAGIMREGVPCVVFPQPSTEALTALEAVAKERKTPLLLGQRDWTLAFPTDSTSALTFTYRSTRRTTDLPQPSLLGRHQYWNAGTAVAALDALPLIVPDEALRQGIATVTWPARLQQLTMGPLAQQLPAGWELWLDGGHNDSAGEVLADQARLWNETAPKPLFLVYGMLTTKEPAEFLTPLAPFIQDIRTVGIESEALAFSPEALADQVRPLGIPVQSALSIPAALASLIQTHAPTRPQARLLICGSLYLAGRVLTINQSPAT
jgi:dihydrofolate synthase/folylpolyglutamate synthase